MQGLENPTRQVMANFESLDAARRERGAWLDRLGFAPVRTPSRISWTGPRARLLSFAGSGSGPALLIVPAPVKRAYIWDLVPDVSVVRRCLEAGLSVHLLEWTDPDEADSRLGLGEHVEQVIAPALDHVLEATGEPNAVLAGHSLGGTLAAIMAALHPERVAGLVLIETPLTFDSQAGALAAMVAATPRSTVAELGVRCVPGSLLSSWAVLAAPDAFLWGPSLDWLASATSDSAALHTRVRRWIEDELAMPGRLFVDIVEGLYRDNRFAAGTLTIDGAPAAPRQLAALRLLIVVERESRIVPPHSALGLFASLPELDLSVLAYKEETGVALQHVGALVGPDAHRSLWPKILTWIDQREAEPPPA